MTTGIAPKAGVIPDDEYCGRTDLTKAVNAENGTAWRGWITGESGKKSWKSVS